jgi:hypothetical protein
VVSLGRDDRDRNALKLLDIFGAEKLRFGVYKAKFTSCFITIYKTPGFMECNLKRKEIKDPAYIAWFLLKNLSKQGVHKSCSIREIVHGTAQDASGKATHTKSLNCVHHK